MRVIDVRHMGQPRVIGCFEHEGVLVDPGPESTVQTLLTALDGLEPRAILLTHIHFDHAGATGALLRHWPGLPVYVHERGAPHIADPERLVRSATRLYGEDGMKELWGEVVPVPKENLHVLSGGEMLLGEYRVEYTPGHASHHVSYLHEPTGTALVGDVAGVRILDAELVLAPTPPPDIDVPLWERSIEIVETWDPDALALTHYGEVRDVGPHLQRLREALHMEEQWARELDEDAFIARVRAHVEERLDAETAASFLQAAPPVHLFKGLDRWLSSAP